VVNLRWPERASGKDSGQNAESMGLLMAPTCRAAKAFLHCSSAACTTPRTTEPRTEDRRAGRQPQLLFPTYSISRIAGEVVVRSMAPCPRRVPPTSGRSTSRTATTAVAVHQMEMMLGGIAYPVPPGRPRALQTRSKRTNHCNNPKLHRGGDRSRRPQSTGARDQTVRLSGVANLVGS